MWRTIRLGTKSTHENLPRANSGIRYGNARERGRLLAGRRRSHFEQLSVARLDLFALCQHCSGIRFQKLDRRQRLVTGLLLDLPVKGAMGELVDQHLLS